MTDFYGSEFIAAYKLYRISNRAPIASTEENPTCALDSTGADFNSISFEIKILEKELNPLRYWTAVFGVIEEIRCGLLNSNKRGVKIKNGAVDQLIQIDPF